MNKYKEGQRNKKEEQKTTMNLLKRKMKENMIRKTKNKPHDLQADLNKPKLSATSTSLLASRTEFVNKHLCQNNKKIYQEHLNQNKHVDYDGSVFCIFFDATIHVPSLRGWPFKH